MALLIAIGTEELGFFGAAAGEMTELIAPTTGDASKVLSRQRFRTLARIVTFRTETSAQLDTNKDGRNEVEQVAMVKTSNFDNTPLWDSHGPYVLPP